MGPKTEKLIMVLDAIIALLESDDERYWSGWMRDVRERLQQSDASGIEKLLKAYGGMGSFNDLLLGQSRQEGRLVWKPGHVEMNDRLKELQQEAYQLGEAIRRENDRA